MISNLYFLCLLLCELCSIMPIFPFSEGFFFSIELTYVLFVIKDTQGG